MTRLPARGFVRGELHTSSVSLTATTARPVSDWLLLSRWFEQLDRVAVRILDLNLASARASFHLIPEADASILQGRDARLKIRNAQHDTVPTTRFLALTVRQRPRT
jgi:hypothetical protein